MDKNRKSIAMSHSVANSEKKNKKTKKKKKNNNPIFLWNLQTFQSLLKKKEKKKKPRCLAYVILRSTRKCVHFKNKNKIFKMNYKNWFQKYIFDF